MPRSQTYRTCQHPSPRCKSSVKQVNNCCTEITKRPAKLPTSERTDSIDGPLTMRSYYCPPEDPTLPPPNQFSNGSPCKLWYCVSLKRFENQGISV
jgi:hypothetical protein